MVRWRKHLTPTLPKTPTKIDSNNSTDIEYERREILEAERRGIQQKAGEFFRFYNKADFIGKRRQQGVGTNENRDRSQLNAKR